MPGSVKNSHKANEKQRQDLLPFPEGFARCVSMIIDKKSGEQHEIKRDADVVFETCGGWTIRRSMVED